MKNLFKVFGVIALAAVIGFSMAGCKNDDDGGNNNSSNNNNNNNSVSPVVGTWVGTFDGNQATVVISTGNTWTLNVPALSYSDSGSYSGTGSVATLRSGNVVVGTATANANLVDGTITTITLVLNQSSVAPGTYTLTKQ